MMGRHSIVSTMDLTAEESAMLRGERGEALRLSMSILARLGRLYGAARLVPIALAHVDACLFHQEAWLEFAERLVAGGARVAVPTTLNVGARDQARWREMRTPQALAEKSRRLEECYAAMGCRPTWTCAPYQDEETLPRFGEHCAIAESNAIAFANTVLGARSERYGDFVDIAAAVAGRVPLFGLHTDEGRRGEIVLRLRDLPPEVFDDESFYPVLGYAAGAVAGSRVPVIVGFPPGVRATRDRLKAFCAAIASSGAIGLAHVVGVTPEAPSLEAALGGAVAPETRPIDLRDLRRVRRGLSTTSRKTFELLCLGSPHFSVEETRRLVAALAGRRIHASITAWVFTSRAVREAIAASGDLALLEESGVRVFTDTCAVVTSLSGWKFRTMMTNSAKFAHYAWPTSGLEVVFARLEDCVESSVEGKVVFGREELWRDS